MNLDLTGRQFLTHFELLFLINGIRALWAEDRYAYVTIRAHRGMLLQLKLLTRWFGRADYRQDLIEVIEV